MAAISARVSGQELSRKPYPWLPCCVAACGVGPHIGFTALLHVVLLVWSGAPPSLPLESGMTRVAATAGGTLAGSIAATSGSGGIP